MVEGLLGGTQVVYAFDYRDGRTRPLKGRLARVKLLLESTRRREGGGP